MKIKSQINFKKMELKSEPLSPDNTNEGSILKITKKNNDLDESINNSNNKNTDDLFNNVNLKLNDLDINNNINISRIAKKAQYKIYLPIVTIKIFLLPFL